MADTGPTLRFRDVCIPQKAGEDVLSQLLLAGAPIQYLCMGGTCGTCRVRVLRGQEHLNEVAPGERHWFPDTTGEVRLACQAICKGTGDVVVEQSLKPTRQSKAV
ncbi:MAG: (2Fe-2S)-binding protein [Planctomycetes bacterium]|nr:(2Fe-2S)-binding protein [Planctomycetota bacterium]